MTKITIFRNHDGEYLGFDCLGHAGYADEGEDIVCAGISALVINTINSIGLFTDEPCETDADEDDGEIRLRFTSPAGSRCRIADAVAGTWPAGNTRILMGMIISF